MQVSVNSGYINKLITIIYQKMSFFKVSTVIKLAKRTTYSSLQIVQVKVGSRSHEQTCGMGGGDSVMVNSHSPSQCTIDSA